MQKPSLTSSTNRDLAPGLYLVATPIGNLGDISERAIATLAGADLIAAEDTRHAQKLLTHLGIKKKLVAYHDHNEAKAADHLIRDIKDGKVVALISDAGMPLISDPGYRLVSEAIDEHVLITSVPGANAALCALQLSGFQPLPFYMAGFAPPKSAARLHFLRPLASMQASLIFYEGISRVKDFLEDAKIVFGGDRRCSVARELTKKFEEVKRGTIDDLLAVPFSEKGEVVIVIEGAGDVIAADDQDIIAALRPLLKTMRLKEAVAEVSATLNSPRQQVYRLALTIKDE